MFITSFDRPNLSLTVKKWVSVKEKNKDIIHFIDNHWDEPGIIYCMSRKSAERMATILEKEGISATVYHAGLTPTQREKAQEDFIKDRVTVVCATIAFGMGIDKSNVRWVIHYNLPKSIENYYQEIGRAGRDGLPSDTLMFYSYADIKVLEDYAKESGQKDVNLEKVKRMQAYAEANVCRRRILLNYFGEESPDDCDNCDVCNHPPRRFDGTEIVQKALCASLRAGEELNTNLLVGVLRASTAQEILAKGYDKLKTFGVGRDISAYDWRDYIMQMIHLGYLEIAYDRGSALIVTDLGRKVVFGQARAELAEVSRQDIKPVKKKKVETRFFGADDDMELFEELRKLRKELSAKEMIPPYMVFSDKVLSLIAAYKPTTIEKFEDISGIAEYKSRKYGQIFTKFIRDYRDR